MSQVMLIVRGIPASGKSDFAIKWVTQDRENRARVNRDDIRFSVFGKYDLPPSLELAVTKIEHAQIKALLASRKSVVIDNMNLRVKYLKEYLSIARAAGVTVIHKDFPIELDEAIRRNAARDRVVPEEAIRRIYASFIRKGSFAPFPSLEDFVDDSQTYVADITLPTAYIFDIDGTLALMDGRGPFEWSRVLEDLPNHNVIRMAQLLHANGHKIIVTSGRDAICREDTELWLQANDIPYDSLYMRPVGDVTKDTVIKLDIFNAHIRDNFNVLGVFDDRLMVARLWHSLGLSLFRVGDPEATF